MLIILSRLQYSISPSPHLAQIYNKYSTGFYIIGGQVVTRKTMTVAIAKTP